MLEFDAILVFVVIIFLFISLYKEIVGPGLTFIIAVGILGVFRVLSPSEILSGFANEQIIVIIMLLLLGEIYRQTSVLDIMFDKLFKRTKKPRSFLIKIILVVAPMSAFLNNTPLVAILMPYIHTWSKKNKVTVSKLLMPLSFAAIIGGSATLIGTSTNLIVNGLVIDQNIIPNLQPLGIFEFSYVGVPMIFIGFFYLVFVAYKILPNHKTVTETFSDQRLYQVETHIKKGNEFIGKTIREAQFLDKDGLNLSKIIRKNSSIPQLADDTIIEVEDTLFFSGKTELIAELVNSDPTMVIPSVGMFTRKKHLEVVEIVISHKSHLIGKTLKKINFRRQYDATVIAIHRNGEQISRKTEDTVLKAGDALLILSGDAFAESYKKTLDFYVISKVKEIRRLGFAKTATLIIGTFVVIILNLIGFSSLFMGLLVLITLAQLMKIAKPKDLAQSIDYDLALIIAMSLALGTAMIKTGVADIISHWVIRIFIPLGEIGILAGIYLITSILAAFITNKAAVAIIFPISLTLANNLNLPTTPFILVVAYAAAANFMTPIGYQTNLMVYGPGGYRFRDFIKVGTPLTIIYMVVAILILNFVYF